MENKREKERKESEEREKETKKDEGNVKCMMKTRYFFSHKIIEIEMMDKDYISLEFLEKHTFNFNKSCFNAFFIKYNQQI